MLVLMSSLPPLDPPRPLRRRRGGEDVPHVRTMPLLPDRRSEAQRVERCRRVLARDGQRLVRRFITGGFSVVDRQGNWSDELTLEEVEESLGMLRW